ncbi:MAG: hypothetical protein GPOALKHO_001753 [Sodalis sp.]|nr:MAG: hypothetical protein GPOALKHO_001753 [Sodalis sp.]
MPPHGVVHFIYDLAAKKREEFAIKVLGACDIADADDQMIDDL